MNSNFSAGIIGVLSGIITVAIIAVIVSSRSNTAQVIKAGFGGLTDALSVAVSPVTGGGNRPIGRGSNN